MPKSLKRIAEPDVFNFGKAVTTVLSKIKELNKTHNTLVDEVQYLESRKKQETTDLERLIAEKTEVTKLKADLTEKIITTKSEFMADVSAKREELAIKEADLTKREQEFADANIKAGNILVEQRNELEILSNEHTKEYENGKLSLDKREGELVAREEALTEVRETNDITKARLADSQAQLDEYRTELTLKHEGMNNKITELDKREADIATKETKFEKQRSSLASLASNLENQLSLIESEKSKNKADAEFIKNMNKQLKDKQLELNTREVHLNDRQATALTH